MKKIIFVAATLGGGGSERVMLNLANKMYDKGNKVVMLQTSGKGKRNNAYRLHEGIKIEFAVSVHKNKLLRIIDKTKQIRKIFKKYTGYTIISFLPDVNMYSIIASGCLNNKIIVSERNDPNKEPGNPQLRKIRNLLYKFADHIVFQTADAQQYFGNKIQKKSSIIPNPLNLDELPINAGNIKKRNEAIMVCRVKPQKNIEMLIDAVNEIKEELKGFTFKIYGDGNLYRDKMKDKIREKKLESLIQFMGPTTDVYSKMLESKIYISTSEYEGISNTMLEAMALGVPSIITDCPIGGAKMFIKHNENGILVPVGDYKKLSDEILRLINDEELQKKFSQTSIKIREQLDLNIITNKWLEIV